MNEHVYSVRICENLEFTSKIMEINRSSFDFYQYLRLSASPDKILCKAEIKIACVNEDMRPRALPNMPSFEHIRSTLT